VKGSSFSFSLNSSSGESFSSDSSGSIRQIREIAALYDVGPVLVPAYPSTSAAVAMRSYEAWMQSQQAVEIPAEIAKRSLVRDAAAAWTLRLRNV
jgi:phage head maturation protease